MYKTSLELKKKWETLKNKDPFLRIRTAADMLKVSEVELLTTDCGTRVIRLQSDQIRNFLKETPKLGPVTALTRNKYVVHELKGTYENPHITDGKIGFFSGYIDVRILFSSWESAFAVKEIIRNKTFFSFQFFDKNGVSIHKIYLNNNNNLSTYEEFVTKYRDKNQQPLQEVLQKEPIIIKKLDKKSDEIDRFRRDWLDMQDVHDFNPLCKKYGLSKLQALYIAPKAMAYKLSPGSARDLIIKAQKRKVSIMIFVGNPGIVQIYSGLIYQCSEQKGWFNILDECFNLHLYETGIHESWLSYRPTRGSILTTVECYDIQGQLLIQFFGSGKLDTSELPEWKTLVNELIT